MSLNAKKIENENTGFKQPPLEAGVFPARLVQVIGFGLQGQQPFKGEPKPPKQEIHTVYEMVDEFCVDEEGNVLEDKPRWISETIPLNPLSSDLANSTKRYYAIDPNEEKKGDWAKLVGMPVMVTLTATPGKGKHDGKVFNNVAGTQVARQKEADKMPELVNPTRVFDAYSDDTETFATLPEWQQDRIKSHNEFEGSPLALALGGKPTEKKEEGGDEEW